MKRNILIVFFFILGATLEKLGKLVINEIIQLMRDMDRK